MRKLVTTAVLTGLFSLSSMSAQVNAAPVEVGFKMVKCKLFNSSRCARISIRIDSDAYENLGRPVGASYKYNNNNVSNHFVSVNAGDLSYDSSTDQYFAVATGLKVADAAASGASYTLREVCLDDNCHTWSYYDGIKDGSASGGYIYKTVEF